MAKASKQQASFNKEFSNSSSSSEEEQVNQQINEEEDEDELEAVARADISDDDEVTGDNLVDSDEDTAAEDDDNDEQGGDDDAPEIRKRETDKLKEMQKMKKKNIQEILDTQNAAIEADMNNRRKGCLNYLLQQTVLFVHFAKGDSSSSQKKERGSGRHASKVTKEEEDKE